MCAQTGVARSLLIDDAAEILGVSRRTVYNRIREGRLRTVRTLLGTQRVLVESVEELLREESGALIDPGPAARVPAMTSPRP